MDVLSAFLCLLGLYFLTGSALSNISKGDFFVLLSAISYALIILLVQWLTLRIDHHLLLTFYQILFTSIVTLPFVKFDDFYHPMGIKIWICILFCAVFATSFSLYTQIKYQKYTTATKAAVIFTLEPIFAYGFNWLLNRELLSLLQVLGGSIMVFSIIISNLLQTRKMAEN